MADSDSSSNTHSPISGQLKDEETLSKEGDEELSTHDGHSHTNEGEYDDEDAINLEHNDVNYEEDEESTGEEAANEAISNGNNDTHSPGMEEEEPRRFAPVGREEGGQEDVDSFASADQNDTGSRSPEKVHDDRALCASPVSDGELQGEDISVGDDDEDEKGREEFVKAVEEEEMDEDDGKEEKDMEEGECEDLEDGEIVDSDDGIPEMKECSPPPPPQAPAARSAVSSKPLASPPSFISTSSRHPSTTAYVHQPYIPPAGVVYQQPIVVERERELCHFFLRGNCRNGDACRFRHSTRARSSISSSSISTYTYSRISIPPPVGPPISLLSAEFAPPPMLLTRPMETAAAIVARPPPPPVNTESVAWEQGLRKARELVRRQKGLSPEAREEEEVKIGHKDETGQDRDEKNGGDEDEQSQSPPLGAISPGDDQQSPLSAGIVDGRMNNSNYFRSAPPISSRMLVESVSVVTSSSSAGGATNASSRLASRVVVVGKSSSAEKPIPSLIDSIFDTPIQPPARAVVNRSEDVMTARREQRDKRQVLSTGGYSDPWARGARNHGSYQHADSTSRVARKRHRHNSSLSVSSSEGEQKQERTRHQPHHRQNHTSSRFTYGQGREAVAATTRRYSPTNSQQRQRQKGRRGPRTKYPRRESTEVFAGDVKRRRQSSTGRSRSTSRRRSQQVGEQQQKVASSPGGRQQFGRQVSSSRNSGESSTRRLKRRKTNESEGSSSLNSSPSAARKDGKMMRPEPISPDGEPVKRRSSSSSSSSTSSLSSSTSSSTTNTPRKVAPTAMATTLGSLLKAAPQSSSKPAKNASKKGGGATSRKGPKTPPIEDRPRSRRSNSNSSTSLGSQKGRRRPSDGLTRRGGGPGRVQKSHGTAQNGGRGGAGGKSSAQKPAANPHVKAAKKEDEEEEEAPAAYRIAAHPAVDVIAKLEDKKKERKRGRSSSASSSISSLTTSSTSSNNSSSRSASRKPAKKKGTAGSKSIGVVPASAPEPAVATVEVCSSTKQMEGGTDGGTPLKAKKADIQVANPPISGSDAEEKRKKSEDSSGSPPGKRKAFVSSFVEIDEPKAPATSTNSVDGKEVGTAQGTSQVDGAGESGTQKQLIARKRKEELRQRLQSIEEAIAKKKTEKITSDACAE